MNNDAVIQGIWGVVTLLILATISLTLLRGCEVSTSAHEKIGKTCVEAGGSWIPSRGDSYQCIAKTGL